MKADASPEHVPLKLRERFRELEKAVQETRQLLARLRELGAAQRPPPAGGERPEEEARQSDDVRQDRDIPARSVVARL